MLLLIFYHQSHIWQNSNRLISDFDFWHVNSHEWKKQGLLTGFLKKFSLGEMAILGPKIVHTLNSGSAGRIF